MDSPQFSHYRNYQGKKVPSRERPVELLIPPTQSKVRTVLLTTGHNSETKRANLASAHTASGIPMLHNDSLFSTGVNLAKMRCPQSDEKAPKTVPEGRINTVLIT